MYAFKVPPKQLSSLFNAREFLGAGSVASQIKQALNSYLDGIEKEIGCPISDAVNAIQEHDREKESAID